MSANTLSPVRVSFLEESPDGLRSAKQATSPVTCLVSSRTGLLMNPGHGSRTNLDCPGVYLLVGPPDPTDEAWLTNPRLYVGQADSVADRLDQHLADEAKNWFQTAFVIRLADESPLNISQCKFMESRLCDLASKARVCKVMNKNSPQPAYLAASDQSDVENFLDDALVVLSAFGLDAFKRNTAIVESSNEQNVSIGNAVNAPPKVSTSMKPLLEELKAAIAGPLFPKAQWYWTRTPDYRAKVVRNGDDRWFLVIKVAEHWLRIIPRRGMEAFKIASSHDLEEHRKEILAAYRTAEEYLMRGK